MSLIQEIRIKIKRRHYEYSKHAVDQSVIRDISVAELEDAIAEDSVIIENYPDDKYAQVASSFVIQKQAGHCISSAAIRVVRLSKSLLYMNLTLSCGSISGSEGNTKGDLE